MGFEAEEINSFATLPREFRTETAFWTFPSKFYHDRHCDRFQIIQSDISKEPGDQQEDKKRDLASSTNTKIKVF